MTDNEIRSKVYELTRPDWWFKSNNWKRMHGYPMLHHQKETKYKMRNKSKFELFSFIEEVIDERVIEATRKDISSFAPIGNVCFGNRNIMLLKYCFH